MRGTYWLHTRTGWQKTATLEAALELVDTSSWEVFVQYGRGKPQLVRWGQSEVA